MHEFLLGSAMLDRSKGRDYKRVILDSPHLRLSMRLTASPQRTIYNETAKDGCQAEGTPVVTEAKVLRRLQSQGTSSCHQQARYRSCCLCSRLKEENLYLRPRGVDRKQEWPETNTFMQKSQKHTIMRIFTRTLITHDVAPPSTSVPRAIRVEQ
jgi:hypothetical protein